MFERVVVSPVRPPLAASATLHAGRSSRAFLQPKLVVGPADDLYEREADRVAEAVIGKGPAGYEEAPLKSVLQAPETVQRKCAKCEEEEAQGMVQGKDATSPGPVEPAVASRILDSQESGKRLAPSERAFFEPRFGHRFDQVRIHHDGRAAELSARFGARALTHGHDIYFAGGEYVPESQEGRRLLAHELTHTLQQAH